MPPGLEHSAKMSWGGARPASDRSTLETTGSARECGGCYQLETHPAASRPPRWRRSPTGRPIAQATLVALGTLLLAPIKNLILAGRHVSSMCSTADLFHGRA